MSKRRKIPKIQWVIIYHGACSSFPTLDHRPCWNSKKAAQIAIANSVDKAKYEIVKYVKAYEA